MSFNTKLKIACIGAGKMLTALISGLVAQGYPPGHIIATRRDLSALEYLAKRLAIQVTADNAHAAAQADIIILGVKPKQVVAVLPELQPCCQGKLIVSILAGVSVHSLQLGLASGTETATGLSVIRAMPNLPCQITQGITGLFAAVGVSAEHKQWVQNLFAVVGKTLWLQQEAMMHVLTVVSGSGPAYFFLLQEYLMSFACQQGFARDEAETLVQQTMLGAAMMSGQCKEDVSTLRAMITSPGGVTEEVMHYLKQHNLEQIWSAALTSGRVHSHMLAQNGDARNDAKNTEQLKKNSD